MGINPAVFFTNYYLFVYEFIFMQDAIQTFNGATSRAQRWEVLRVLQAFRFTKRFVDDLSILTLTPPNFVENFLYVDQVHNGVHGIYPRPLVLHSTTVQNGRILRSLDVEVFPAHGVSGPLFTRLYDKRRQPAFTRALTIMRFPAADSKLSTTCKLNVFDSRFVSMARIITDVGSFVAEVVSLMVDMARDGYSRSALLRRCRRRISLTPFLFGIAQGLPVHGGLQRGLYKTIKDKFMNKI